MLKYPNASLLANIAQGWNAIYPKDLIDTKVDLKGDLIGTGPFKLKSYQRGTTLELVKNPEYHVAGRPYLDGITFYLIPDSNTIFSGLLSGQILMWRTSDKPELDEITRQVGDQIRVTKVMDASTHVLELNARRKPWDDARVRRAVSLAIDRQAALQIVTQGEGFVAGVMLPGGSWAISEAELQTMPGFGSDKAKDLEEARRLMAEAGVAGGGSLKTVLLTRKGPQYEPVSIFLKDQLSKLGIDVSLDVQESAAFFDRLNKREFDGLGASYSVAVDDPDAVFGQSYISTASRNYSGVQIKEIDEMFAKQSQTMDVAERKKLVNELEKRVLTDAVKAVMARRGSYHMEWSKVQGYKAQWSQYNNQRHDGVWLTNA